MKSVYLLTGNDTAAITAAARRLVESIAGKEPDDFALEIHREQDDRAAQDVIHELIGSLLTPPFLGDKKTLWLQCPTLLELEGGAAELKRQEPAAVAFARLVDIINNRFPPHACLVISGPGADARRQLCKSCAAHGEVRQFRKPDMLKWAWRGEMAGIIRQLLAEFGMTLTPESIEYLVEAVGTDTGRLRAEIEKLYCYAGERPTISDVKELCASARETHFFALANAFGERDLRATLVATAQLYAHADDSERLALHQVRYLGKYFTELLHARVFMDRFKIRAGPALLSKIQGLTEAETALFQHSPILTKTDGQLKMIASQATKYSVAQLVQAVAVLAETDRRLVSASVSKRLVLEQTVMAILGDNGQPVRR